MTPRELEALLRQHGSTAPPRDPGDDDAERLRGERTALLAPVLRACEDARASPSAALDGLAEKLADGGRDAAWRRPLGDSGILAFFLAVLAGDDDDDAAPRPGLRRHALRLVGNACADTDGNRARVVAHELGLACVSRHLGDDALAPLAVPVLYNVMVDYDAAQRLASRSRLSRRLVPLLTLPNLAERPAVVLYASKALALLAEQEVEASVADPAVVGVLLGLAAGDPARTDPDCFASLVEAAVAYLANEGFQSRLVSEGQVGLFLDVLRHLHDGPPQDHGDDPDLAARLKQLRSALLTLLADLSGTDAFSSRHPLSSPVAQTLLAWLRGPTPALQAAACLVLGNLSRSDRASVDLVDEYAVDAALAELLSDPAVGDSQLIHLALSFCRNLAIPPQNRVRLGRLLEHGRLPRVLALDTLPQVQFAAVSLTRLLLTNCPPNVRCVLTADPSDTDRGHAAAAAAIVSLFDRSDAEPTKLEAARSLMTLCRALHSPAASDVLPARHGVASPSGPGSASAGGGEAEDAARRRLFYDKHSPSAALAFLVSLPKWPALRSEAWFILALMSRSADGAAVVSAVLQGQPAADALVGTVTGRDASESEPGAAGQAPQRSHAPPADGAIDPPPGGLQPEPRQADGAEQRAARTKADRENALVLCTKLLRGGEGRLPPPTLALLQGLVEQGAELVVADRSLE